MITKPPPKDSAPTLNAVHASEPSPPTRAARAPSAAAGAQWKPAAAVGRRLQRQLDQAAREQHEHEVGPDQRRGGGARAEVGEPARGARAIRAHAAVAWPEQPARRVHRDRRDGGAGTRAGAADQQRRRVGEEDDGEREDQDDGGNDEAEPADDRAGDAADAVGAEDRKLRRGGAGQQSAGGVCVLELAGLHPALAVDHQPPQERDVCRRAAEAGDADPAPRLRDPRERRARRARGVGAHHVFSGAREPPARLRRERAGPPRRRATRAR